MLKETAIKHFGSAAAVGRAIGRAPSAVTEWPDVVPEGMAYKIQVITGGLLQVDQALYQKTRERATAK
ncbi:DNA-binding transcriptional regulator DicC [uncultured Caudovirales phage]|uniref:DNA-binding transcriptional regulator DicC n=1 Tax=uncultured Caudovirales phage TaxID=2100421 RepID=A0A6J5T6M0_9CAUD|nr:DNA-binding transcriptional regulator DicC [uncultured Caudovirales phage]